MHFIQQINGRSKDVTMAKEVVAKCKMKRGTKGAPSFFLFFFFYELWAMERVGTKGDGRSSMIMIFELVCFYSNTFSHIDLMPYGVK